eukprot:4469963-Pleurochrysis_carterae.AAC.2
MLAASLAWLRHGCYVTCINGNAQRHNGSFTNTSHIRRISGYPKMGWPLTTGSDLRDDSGCVKHGARVTTTGDYLQLMLGRVQDIHNVLLGWHVLCAAAAGTFSFTHQGTYKDYSE